MNFPKKFIYWLLIISYLEFNFRIFSKNIFTLEILGNILIFSCLISSIICLFNNKFTKYIITLVLGFYFSLQYIFYDVFVSYFSFDLLSSSEQLASFKKEVINAIISNTHLIIIFFLPFILTIILKRYFLNNKFNLKDYISNILAIILSMLLLIININMNKNIPNSINDLLFNINENALNIEKLGVLPSCLIDIKRSIFGFDIKIEQIEDEKIIEEYEYNILNINFNDINNNIKTINQYIQSLTGSQKNEYTGIFKGYNLIYITAESFSQIGVSETLTPTLYKLINSGFVFTNFYTPNNSSTLGGEFQSLTGLFASNSILNKWKSGNNTFPFGLATTFKNINYNTYAYHNHNYKFQNRNNYLKSIGFDNFKGCGNGLEKLINCNIWPESDYDMVNVTIDDYINNEPFLAYYMTVSGHFGYAFSSNSMANKHKEKVKNLNYSENVKAYLATQIELDLALEKLINTLEEKNILDKTVIVMQADHYPYNLSINDINSISTYKRDNVIEVNHNSLIIWNNKIEKTIVDKVCMSIDVIPTIYNLFGIEYDSRLFVGNDIFSNKEGIAYFTNHSWVTNYGTYYANNSKFVSNSEEIDENYINKTQEIVSNRINISKMIIANDYYKYIDFE